MTRLRVLVCGAALCVALVPLAAFADDMTHEQDEVANAEAQLADAQQDVRDMQMQAQQDAANERMIALLRSEAMRERQLDLVSNSTAMEQIAGSLATAARANGEADARNALAIAQIKAAALLAPIEGNLANARMLAQTKG